MRARPATLALRGWAAALILVLVPCGAVAEPYLAVRHGLKCSGCHVNPTGGGLRNAAGHAITQNELAARRIDSGETPWLGQVSRFLSIGGDLRAGATYTDLPDAEDQDLAFAVDELRVYFDFSVIPDRLSLYVDQRLAPDDSRNLEAYGRLWLDQERRHYVKAGQMYLPYGLRLEDDTAFIRQATGITFDSPDNGVELGLEQGPWSAQLAISNGTGGGPETDSGKQWSLRGEYLRNRWRLGTSYSFNDSESGDRHLAALFGGLRSGPVAWLAEAGFIEDRGLPGGPQRRWVGLLEANWEPRRGHNLKATFERLEPDDDIDDDALDRFSLVWEFTPIEYLQLRGGVRDSEGQLTGVPQDRTFGFIELHAFF